MVGLFCCTALHALVLCRFSSCVVIGEVTHRLSTERKVEEIGIEGLSDKFLSHFITFHHQVLDRKCGNERPIPCCRSCRNIIHPNCGFWRQLRDLEAANLRVPGGLLKAS